MKITLLRGKVINMETHVRGDVVDCPDADARHLIYTKAAVEGEKKLPPLPEPKAAPAPAKK